MWGSSEGSTYMSINWLCEWSLFFRMKSIQYIFLYIKLSDNCVTAYSICVDTWFLIQFKDFFYFMKCALNKWQFFLEIFCFIVIFKSKDDFIVNLCFLSNEEKFEYLNFEIICVWKNLQVVEVNSNINRNLKA